VEFLPQLKSLNHQLRKDFSTNTENKSLCLFTFLDPRLKTTFLRSDMKNKIKECAFEALEQCQMEVRGDSLDDISTGYASSNSTEDQDATGFTMTFSSLFDKLVSA
jgi:hypothetical protein